MEQKLRKGECVAKAPYGYKNVVLENGKKDVALDEYAACIVHKAFELYATGAYSMDLVCKKIKEDYGLEWRVSYIDNNAGKPYIYRGLLRCAVCGLAITQALSNLFKKLQLPQEAVASINYTLNELHENKASFERKQYLPGRCFIYRFTQTAEPHKPI